MLMVTSLQQTDLHWEIDKLTSKKFKDGKVYYHYSNFFGYLKGSDDLPEIDAEQSAVVGRIFSRQWLGQSVRQITVILWRMV